MNVTAKLLRKNISALRESDRTFRDLYGILFSEEQRMRVMCETVTTLRIRRVTYGDVYRSAEVLAAAIAARFGSNGRYIGLCGKNSVEWTVLFWAILRSGNCPCLVHQQQPDAVAASVLGALDARAMLFLDGEENGFAAYPCETASYATLRSEGAEMPLLGNGAPFGDCVAVTADGSAAEEKICIYSGRRFSERILNTERIVGENPIVRGDPKTGVKQLAVLPFCHISGLSAVYLCSSFFGAIFVFPQNPSYEAILDAARRCDVTHVFAAPLFWRSIERAVLREISARPEAEQEKFRTRIERSLCLQSRFPRLGGRIASGRMRELREHLLPDSVRFCVSCGDGLCTSAIRLVNALGYPLSNGYGTSEIGIASAELSRSAEERACASIGRPFGSVEYRITEEGHLAVRGSSLCDRMLVNGIPRTVDGWLDTNDLVTEENGRYFFRGRASDLLPGENGEALNPTRIEEAFLLPFAVNCAVIGEKQAGEPVLVVQLPDGISDTEWETLTAEAADSNAALPPSMQVTEVLYTFDPLLQPTELGINRGRLREEIDAGRIRFVTSGAGVSSERRGASEIRARICALMAEILGIDGDTIPGDAHFMHDLGGSSLDYYMLIGELDRTFAVRVPYESENFTYCLDDFETLIKELLKAHV